MQFDYRRTHDCGSLQSSHIGQTITLSGWVNKRRDHGNLIFIDLRDRFGITQLIFDPHFSIEAHCQAEKIRSEWVISIKGKVRARGQGLTNPKLKTGEIEIEVQHILILSQAKTPPFPIAEEEIEVQEDIRLKYRYLDIRRGKVAHHLILRHQAMLATRNFMDTHRFLEIQTPILAKSTPEGARDYLVPSRIYPGNFYALPQSPQIFKQLLMIGGMDRYFQIATCFRDEDLRADRQPEFTQIDIEMSFAYPSDLMHLIESLMAEIFKKCLSLSIKTPFLRLSHAECLEKFGTDRPDLRFGMPLFRLDHIAKRSTFSIFQGHLAKEGSVKGLCVRGGADISRKKIEDYGSFVSKFGIDGLAWMKREEKGFSSQIVKFFSEELLLELQQLFSAEVGDLILMAAGPLNKINQGLDHLRRHIAKERALISQDALNFLWVVDFPLFRYNEEERRIESEHHPFTAPRSDDFSLLEKDPLKVRAEAYDLVLNGYEIGGGSQRIHQGELQQKIFELLQLSPKEIEEKFGFFVDALKYGTPPHLGIALGLDRIVMLLAKTEHIREVIAFPKTQKASDLMMQSPSSVHPKQLQELKITTQPAEIIW